MKKNVMVAVLGVASLSCAMASFAVDKNFTREISVNSGTPMVNGKVYNSAPSENRGPFTVNLKNSTAGAPNTVAPQSEALMSIKVKPGNTVTLNYELVDTSGEQENLDCSVSYTNTGIGDVNSNHIVTVKVFSPNSDNMVIPCMVTQNGSIVFYTHNANVTLY